MENTSTNTSLEILTKDFKEVLPNAPRGPLDAFRNRGTFDWRKMKVNIETEEFVRYKHYLWDLMRKDPLFEHPNKTLSADEEKHLTTKRMFSWLQKDLIPDKKWQLRAAYLEALLIYNGGFSVKSSITFSMVPNALLGMGSDEQYQKYIKLLESGEINGCFALTEVAHGSNAKGMRTTATYQPDTKDFLLHSPDFEAAKCWVGGLGKTATHALVYAQLLSKGQHHGLHAFFVPIRCPHTLRPYKGMIVGDMGEKIGLNGVDNGFIMFNNYRIPFENQLNRLGGININGDYETSFKDPGRRFGASLGILSAGRVNIGGLATVYLQKGVTIAVRYAAIRRQFSDTSNASEETPILEYQSVQTRIIPYLSSVFAMKIFSLWFSSQHSKMVSGDIDDSKINLAELGMEMHALSSATKPFCSWMARDGLQACRELCSGHGYLTAAGIGAVRNDNDANCTYEGENSVLIQQTFNWLISLWSKRSSPDIFNTPLHTVYYFKDADGILKQKANPQSIDEAINIENLLKAYKWLVLYMLKSTAEKFEGITQKNGNSLKARNDSQSYYGLPTAIIFVEHYVLEHVYNFAAALETSNEKRVLLDLVSLFGSWLLEKHMGLLYMGGYWSGASSGELIREGVIQLCKKISTEAVLLVDVLAPPDFILNSVLGMSDGEMYNHLQNAIFTGPEALSRPSWWQDVTNWKSYVSAKL